MTDSPLHLAVTRFLRYLGVERQLSPITLLNYQRQLDAIIALAGKSACSAGNNVMPPRYGLLPCAVAARAGSRQSGATPFGFTQLL